jgi:hypothetical protein
MDYSKIYIELIERSFNRFLDGYVEKHHVIPKCMGGDDLPRNIAVLTPEEHYLAHLLLVKIYPNSKQLTYAANMMTVNGKCDRTKNKQFGWLKRQFSENQKGKNNHMFGKVVSQETRDKIGAANRGKKRKPFSDEHKKNIGLASIGRKTRLGATLLEETKEKIRNSLTGRKLSEEVKKKLRGRKCTEATKIRLAEYNRSPDNKNKKLNDEDVINIRIRYKQGNVGYKTLSEEYDVTKGTIGHSINNRTWTNLPKISEL